MTKLPYYLRATGAEYRLRYLLHGAIYTLCLAAPWHPPVWGFLRNGSCWFLAADAASRPTFESFAPVWNALCAGAVVFAAAGAGMRVWGAAFLGAATVHQSALHGSRLVASGPYRYVRNPLYLGTLLHTVAVALLMRPEVAVLALVLIAVLQVRLIGHEEAFLLRQQGDSYQIYAEEVPRLVPRLQPAGAPMAIRADWRQGVLSEIYPIGVTFTFLIFGWTRGYAWDASLVHVVQGIVISLGAAVVARAFIRKN